MQVNELYLVNVEGLQTAALSRVGRFTCVSLTKVRSCVLVPSEVDRIILVDRHWQVPPLTHSEQQLPRRHLVPPLVHPRADGQGQRNVFQTGGIEKSF